MKPPGRKKLYILLAMLIAIGGLAFGYRVFSRAQAIQITQEWARVDPLPASVTSINVDVRGSMFTREFVISFEAPRQDIETWLASSKGTRDATVEVEHGSRVYQIQPGGGAQFAEVRVDESGMKVTIRVYWS